MNLTLYLNKKKLAQRRKCRSILNHLSRSDDICNRLVKNLFRESSLTVRDWDKFFSTLVPLALDRVGMQNAIKIFCQARTLRGKKTPIETNTTLGRVISFERFCQMLVKHRYYPSTAIAKADVRRLINADVHSLGRKWNTQKLGIYLMWSTLDAKGQTPFANLPSNVNDLVCSLGLEPIAGLVLLLEYKLPVNVESRVPTICDAYAGLVWSKYFHRSLISSKFGMTIPTEACVTRGRPEVVHQVVEGKDLAAPMRFA